MTWRQRLVLIPSWAWHHRTKMMGCSTMLYAYIQTNDAQLSVMLTPEKQEYILFFIGLLVFLIGLYNTLIGDDLP